MAQIKIPIVIKGLDFVKEQVQRFMDEAEFEDDVSEEYKKGFYDFGNAIVATIGKMQEEGE